MTEVTWFLETSRLRCDLTELEGRMLVYSLSMLDNRVLNDMHRWTIRCQWCRKSCFVVHRLSHSSLRFHHSHHSALHHFLAQTRLQDTGMRQKPCGTPHGGLGRLAEQSPLTGYVNRTPSHVTFSRVSLHS